MSIPWTVEHKLVVSLMGSPHSSQPIQQPFPFAVSITVVPSKTVQSAIQRLFPFAVSLTVVPSKTVPSAHPTTISVCWSIKNYRAKNGSAHGPVFVIFKRWCRHRLDHKKSTEKVQCHFLFIPLLLLGPWCFICSAVRLAQSQVVSGEILRDPRPQEVGDGENTNT